MPDNTSTRLTAHVGGVPYKKPMDLDSLEKIVRAHTRDEIREVGRIENKGTVNDIYILTGKSGKYVLRVDRNEDTTARFKKEQWCIEAANRAGIPGPIVLGLGIEEFRPYLLISHIDGIHGEETAGSDQRRIWEKLGGYARTIHSLPVKGFGEDMILPGIFKDSWERYLAYNISCLTPDDKLLSLGLFKLSEIEILKNAFRELEHARFSFGLIHNDLALRNTILAPHNRVFLFDWGSAQVDVVPHMDLAEILHSSLKDGSEGFGIFLKSYGMTLREFEIIKPDLLRLQLLRFTDTLRWAMDRRPEMINEKAGELRRLIAQIKIKPHTQE